MSSGSIASAKIIIVERFEPVLKHGGAYRMFCTAVCKYNTVLDVWWKFHVSTLFRALPGAPYSEHRSEHHAQSTAVRARLSQMACEPAMPFSQGQLTIPASPASPANQTSPARPACSQDTAHPRAMADMAMAPRLILGQGALGPQLQHL